MTDPGHWDAVYDAREEDRLTWFEAEPVLSRELIDTHAAPGGSVIDVGGGASRLVDVLLGQGRAVTVLDLSAGALAASRERLGPDAARAEWRAGDVTDFAPDRTWDVWHDRAVFHFLTEPEARAGYVRAMEASLAPGGIAIVMTFAPDGPETCSSLPVERYSPESLRAEIDRLAPGAFAPVTQGRHVHRTPLGREQAFQFSVLQKLPEPPR